MKVADVEFGPVWGASGTQGFYGEGYRHHELMHNFVPGFNFGRMTFVAKTTTLGPRQGNMELEADGITPKKFLPNCIYVRPRSWLYGAALNSVGLSGPGARALLDDGRWQKKRNRFMLSFMSIAATPEERILEAEKFFAMLLPELKNFRGRIGLQINFSCPNVGLDADELAKEVLKVLDIIGVLKVPIIPKFNVVTPAKLVAEIAKHENCHAICVSNTLPWDNVPEWYRKKVFGNVKSPLEKLGYGGGGLSGKYLLNQVLDWLFEARQAGISVPINAGGGILSAKDVPLLKDEGAGSVFIGSVAFLRPWRIKSIINSAYAEFS